MCHTNFMNDIKYLHNNENKLQMEFDTTEGADRSHKTQPPLALRQSLHHIFSFTIIINKYNKYQIRPALSPRTHTRVFSTSHVAFPLFLLSFVRC